MNLNITAFGIAKDIIGSRTVNFDAKAIKNISQFKTALFEQYPELVNLKSLAIAVDEEYRSDTYELKEDMDIVLIPPVSGG